MQQHLLPIRPIPSGRVWCSLHPTRASPVGQHLFPVSIVHGHCSQSSIRERIDKTLPVVPCSLLVQEPCPVESGVARVIGLVIAGLVPNLPLGPIGIVEEMNVWKPLIGQKLVLVVPQSAPPDAQATAFQEHEPLVPDYVTSVGQGCSQASHGVDTLLAGGGSSQSEQRRMLSNHHFCIGGISLTVVAQRSQPAGCPTDTSNCTPHFSQAPCFR